jgi:ribulose 1,5-bisphosphate synthetase/thiazole synthase
MRVIILLFSILIIFIAYVYKQQDNVNKTEVSIAVIGAGPSGISLVYWLNKLGYTNITVFEASSTIGGQSKTISIYLIMPMILELLLLQ